MSTERAQQATKPKTMFLLYDDRAAYDVDRAMVLVTCLSLREARSYRRDMGGLIFEYDVNEKGELVNERGPIQ